MDLAKSLATWRDQSPEQRFKTANRILPPVVIAVLLLAISYRLAELTWALIPHHAFDSPAPRIVQPTAPESGRSAANFSALEDSHLFGKAAAEPAAPPEPVNTELDAPETTLPLTLNGVTVDETGGKSQAHITTGRAEQRNYGVGEEIENANGAKLHAVYADRVIINRGGQLETLRFPEIATTSAGRVAPPPAPAARTVYPQEDTPVRNVVTENAPNIANVFRMAPHMEGDRMIGFRLNPGRDRETFEALGLQPGDIVTDINGIALDDPAKALQIFDALGESTQASVTIVREGVPNVLVIDTTQIQSLMNDRQ